MIVPSLIGLTLEQMRLLAVWRARQFQHLMTDPRSIEALDVAERHAYKNATDEELKAAMVAARDAQDDVIDILPLSLRRRTAFFAAGAAKWAAWPNAGGTAHVWNDTNEIEKELLEQMFEKVRNME